MSGRRDREWGDATRYLLAAMSGKQRVAFEKRYFADDATFEQVCAVEEELIAAFLRGNLGYWNRRRFRKVYLSDPKKLRLVESTARLMEFARPSSLSPPRRGLFAGIPAVVPVMASVVACLFCGWTLLRDRGESRALALLRADQVGVFSITPEAGVARADGPPVRWRIPEGARLVALHMDRPEGQTSGPFWARVLTPDLVVVWEGPEAADGEPKTGKELVFALPSGTIPAGDYIVRVEQREPAGRYEVVGDYSFSVARPRGDGGPPGEPGPSRPVPR